jgi:hypothetical protein
MARSTVGEPNRQKAIAAGAEGAKKTPPWNHDNYDGRAFRIRGHDLESLQVRTKIDGPVTSAHGEGIFEMNIGTFDASQVRKLLDDVSRLQDPKWIL